MNDFWSKKTSEVSREYEGSGNNQISMGHGSYFYDNYYGPNYYVQEQNRLRGVVHAKRDAIRSEFS